MFPNPFLIISFSFLIFIEISLNLFSDHRIDLLYNLSLLNFLILQVIFEAKCFLKNFSFMFWVELFKFVCCFLFILNFSFQFEVLFNYVIETKQPQITFILTGPKQNEVSLFHLEFEFETPSGLNSLKSAMVSVQVFY